MNRLLSALFLLCLWGAPSWATTYDYVGRPLTSNSAPGCGFTCTNLSGLIGTVTFDLDTSNFSGVIALTPGDQASLDGGGINYFYPASAPPAGVYGIVNTLSGSFTFIDGLITGWSLNGSVFQQNCPGGAGCNYGDGNASSSPTSDFYSAFNVDTVMYYSASNNGGGVWVQAVAQAVPEPSTWAMPILGFAGIGLMAYLRNREQTLQVAGLVL